MSYNWNVYGTEFLELCCNWKMNWPLSPYFFLYNQVTAIYLNCVCNSSTSPLLKSWFLPSCTSYILKLSHHLKQMYSEWLCVSCTQIKTDVSPVYRCIRQCDNKSSGNYKRPIDITCFLIPIRMTYIF